MYRKVLGRHQAATIISMLILFVILLAACGRDADDQPGTYRDDGYLGITQTNPNLQTSPTERSHYEDTQMMRRTLMSIDGIKQVQTFANGPHVYVYLSLDDGLAAAEREKIRSTAEKALSFNNPRFDYTVRLR